MCTALLTSWDGTVRNLRGRVAIVITARSSYDRVSTFRQERGFRDVDIFADEDGAYTRAYLSPGDSDAAGLSVFTRRDGTLPILEYGDDR